MAVEEAKPMRKPSWLKVTIPRGENYQHLREQRKTLGLATVCEEAGCPNIGECWNSRTATFMMMGDTCTRGCRFCSVKTAKTPAPLDASEPQKLAQTVKGMGLKYVVLTTVDRDELEDQGSKHIRECVDVIQQANPELLIEALIPDFRGEEALIQEVVNSKAKVLAHNIECVLRLTETVRDPRAGYQQSLDVLDYMKKHTLDAYTKSSIMIGLGETEEEVLETMRDLRKVNVDFLTIGQYLQPNKKKLPVIEYVHPDQFKKYEELGLEMGFQYVASGPLVRSSYKAAEFYINKLIRKEGNA
ncbi:MAG: lipoic acid synthetase [bacterium]|jgi:lipoic acid synthetase